MIINVNDGSITVAVDVEAFLLELADPRKFINISDEELRGVCFGLQESLRAVTGILTKEAPITDARVEFRKTLGEQLKDISEGLLAVIV